MLLALVPSGRFIGNLTAVPTSERSVSVSGCCQSVFLRAALISGSFIAEVKLLFNVRSKMTS